MNFLRTSPDGSSECSCDEKKVENEERVSSALVVLFFVITIELPLYMNIKFI